MLQYETFFQRLEPTARVLDVGCGNGHLTAKIAQHVPSGFVLGVENHYQTLISAMLNYRVEHCPNLRFQQADAKRLRLQQKPFDYVLSKGCLHYLQHPGHAFKAIARNLRPGGVLYSWCLGRNSAGKVNKVFRQLRKAEQWKPYLADWQVSWSYATYESCLPWLAEAGLTSVQGLMVEEDLDFPERGAFIEWLRRNWAYLERIPYTMVEVFEDQFLQSYLAINQDRYNAQRVWLVIEACKPEA